MEFIIPTPEQPLHPHIAGKLIHEISIGTGESDEGRFNAWNVDVYLVHDQHRTLFALRGTRYCVPDDEEEDDLDAPSETSILLVMADPLVDNNDWIAWRLLKEYDSLGRPSISFYDDTDEVDLDRGEQMNWELELED
jgi:hypothetical protein